MHAYELWNMETGNMIGSYESEREALRDVVEDLDVIGGEAAEMLGLIERFGPEELRVLAQGPQLIQLAQRTLTAQV